MHVTAVSVKSASYARNISSDACVFICNRAEKVKGSPVKRADGIQNILDSILPLHALLAFVYHRCQVLHVGFGGKKKKEYLLFSFSLTFRNVKPL